MLCLCGARRQAWWRPLTLWVMPLNRCCHIPHLGGREGGNKTKGTANVEAGLALPDLGAAKPGPYAL